MFGRGRNGGKKWPVPDSARIQPVGLTPASRIPVNARCDIDRADEACTTWRTLVPCRTRVGFHTGMNLAVGPMSDLFVRR
jgi:hypothetical protein